jgi:hypothetical protein
MKIHRSGVSRVNKTESVKSSRQIFCSQDFCCEHEKMLMVISDFVCAEKYLCVQKIFVAEDPQTRVEQNHRRR